jgi:D-alanine-D-alanine ligase
MKMTTVRKAEKSPMPPRPDGKRSGHAANRPPHAPSALAITVLMGGPSGERAVSLESGACVAEALESLGHRVYREDIGPDNLAALARNVDVVFVALHGAFGEDGQVQAILERRGLSYCGSPPSSCALAMDKARAKQRFLEQGLPTPRFEVATPETVEQVLPRWTPPFVVKPVREGSSLNCFIVDKPSAIHPAVTKVLEHYGECLIEEYIPGIELTIGILGEQTLPPIEIRTPRSFYDYEAKYHDDRTEYLFEIDLSADLLADVARMSLAAFRLLGCRDFGRVDWRIDVVRGRPCLLEVNVIPGMTSHSLLPKAAARVGVSMPALCDAIVRMALDRKEI